jgi:ATP-grasp domain, R2K clade family 3
MKPTWVIEPVVFQENEQQLRSIVQKKGMECVCIDFEQQLAQDFKNLPPNDSCVIYYGSLGIMQRLRKHRVWTPGFYGTLENLKCSTYFNYFGKWLFNRTYLMMPLMELVRNRARVCDLLDTNKLFVRPDSGFKQFTGFAIDRDDISLDAFGLGYYYEDPTILVVVAPAMSIQREWRIVICEDRVVTGSRYKSFFEIDESDEITPDYQMAMDYAQSIAKEVAWRPDAMYVMDICKDNFGGFYLLEINSFSCSGLYKCDLEKVVIAASEQSEKEWEDVYGK